MQTAVHVSEVVLGKHYITIPPFNLPNWVMCHQLATLEEAVVLMEAYTLAVVGAYLVLKAWKYQAVKKGTG